jgi:hypothetical protein
MSTDERLSFEQMLKFVKGLDLSFYCKWCKRHIPLQDGVYVHDEVYHPENEIYGEGHKIQ